MKFVVSRHRPRLDLICPGLKHGHKLDMVSEGLLSPVAFAELLNELPLLEQTRIVIRCRESDAHHGPSTS